MTVTLLQQLGMLDRSNGELSETVLSPVDAQTLVNAESVSFRCEGVGSDFSVCCCGG